MEISNAGVIESKQNFGWILVLAVAALQVLSAAMLLIGSGPGTFEADTGVAWNELLTAYPTVADQFLMAQQASLVGNLGLGLVSIAVALFALRNGERWAWFIMWILPASMVPGMLNLAATETQGGVAVFAGLIILIAVVGLLISYRSLRA